MTTLADVRLRKVGVVVTAKFHNPSVLNKDFLINNEIVPSDWEEVQTVSTPIASSIRFRNGILWLIDQERLDISKEYDTQFGDCTDDQVHTLAESYVKLLPHVPYQDIGLNCVVSIVDKNPLLWMTNKFLKDPSRYQDLRLTPRFVMNFTNMVLSLTFASGLVLHDGRKLESIIIDCNCHFSGPFSSEGTQSILSGWENTKNIIASKLEDVLV